MNTPTIIAPPFTHETAVRKVRAAEDAWNTQYISLGNLSENPRAFLFLPDFARRQRVKVWGTARVVEDDRDLLARLTVPGYEGEPERAFVFHVEAWDINCPQHITPRFTEAEIAELTAPLRARIAELERQVAELAGRAGPAGSPT